MYVPRNPNVCWRVLLEDSTCSQVVVFLSVEELPLARFAVMAQYSLDHVEDVINVVPVRRSL